MTRNQSTLARCSTLALAAALATQAAPAAAQSFNGTGTVTSGSATITPGTGTTDISIGSSQVVIDWTPDDNGIGGGTIDFQSAGTTASFFSGTDFAVLNRINVADSGRAVGLNGNIQSFAGDFTGGSVFFYSPSGFVIGSTAAINVGSLVLSASPIAVDGNGGFLQGTSVTFNQAPNPNASISTAAGSQINANGIGNYVALVAPSVIHQGTIRTDTAAALVAAEAATINFSPDGLFDIEVTIGTDAANGVVVNGGTITRNSGTEGVGNHRAYLVSVAKNDAVAMLIQGGGSVGFDTATSASVENNVVILSGGFDVQGGLVSSTSGVSTVAVSIDNATMSSDTGITTTGGVGISSTSGATSFGGDLAVSSGLNTLIDARNGNALTIAGNATATVGSNGSAAGRIVRIGAQNGSTLTVGGDVVLQANSFGGFADFGENGANATGGNAQIIAQSGSTIDIAGSVDLLAEGEGGHVFGDATGGIGQGGQVFLLANDGNSTVNVGGPVYASAQGFGGSTGECTGCNITGGAGLGGTVQFTANVGAGNELNFDGDVTLTAAGNGGSGDVQGGLGRGGTATLGAGDGSTVTVLADTEVDATGFGGFGIDGIGGLGLGGRAIVSTFTSSASLLDLTGPVFVSADGIGGDAATGGTGTGGEAVIAAGLGTVHARGNVSVSAQSNGGTYFFGGDGGNGIADLDGTDLTEAALISNGGTLIVDGLAVVDASAQGGEGTGGGNGGDAQAGSATVHAANNDSAMSVMQFGDLVVTANGYGGAGGSGSSGTDGSPGGNGGDAIGGRAIVTAAAGSGDLTVNNAILAATGEGGQGGDGGSSDGGTGGDGGDGGSGAGGFINVGTESGNVNFAQGANNGSATFNSIIALTSGFGGDGGSGLSGSVDGTPGNGGDAFGGLSTLLVRGAPVTVNTVNLDASATGGNSGLDPNDNASANGGNATTGRVGVLATNRFNLPDQRGSLTVGSVTGIAIATGGSGAVAGGDWTLGGSHFEIVNSDVTIGTLNISVSASGLDPDATETLSSPIAVVNGTATILGDFLFATPGLVSVYTDGGTLTANSLTVSGDNYIHDPDPTRPGPASVGTISAGSMNFLTGADLIIDAHLVSGGGIGLSAPGLIDVEDVTSSDGAITMQAGSSIAGGDLDSAGGIQLDAGSSIAIGDALAAGGFEADALGGSITTGDVTSTAFLVMHANGGIASGNLDSGTGNVWADAQAGSIDVSDVTGGSVELDATGSVDAGNLTATSDFVVVNAGGAINVGDVNAATFAFLESATGGIATGDLSSGDNAELDAAGDILFGNVDAGLGFDFDTAGSVTGGNIFAGSYASGQAGGSVVLGDISAGGSGPSDDGFSVGIAAAGSITVGDVSGTENIGFASLQDLATGDIDAGESLMALVGGDMSFGAIGTSTEGRIYLADVSMFLENGGPDEFDPLPVLAASPVPTGGSITIAGPVTTGLFQAAAGTSLTTGSIDAQQVEASADGTATINGLWSAPVVSLTSNDIEIGAAGGIDAGSSGNVLLVSTNATQALIGDGLTGTGYALGNAEFGRISSGSLMIAARGDASAAADMVIGDLDITGPLAGSTIDDPAGSVIFATGDILSETAGGVIRVDGDVQATGFTANNVVEFLTGRFELNADSGSLVVESNPGTLGGIIDITADRIHVASAGVLSQLAADPDYDGHEEDLNTPIATAKPGGVINAATIFVSPTEAVLVQNTGTADLPAGFKAGVVELFPPEGAAPGSIELIVNGQLVTEAGTLTGVAVRDALVLDTDLSVYTSNSMINGCALTGDCVPVEPPPFFPPGFTPTPGIQDEITLIDQGQLPPPLFGNEEYIDDNDEATDEGETSPIEPPQPLFDTSGLGDKGDIDDPVSGSGNPALMDSPPPPPSGQESKQ